MIVRLRSARERQRITAEVLTVFHELGQQDGPLMMCMYAEIGRGAIRREKMQRVARAHGI